jgi:hypothetical protein
MKPNCIPLVALLIAITSFGHAFQANDAPKGIPSQMRKTTTPTKLDLATSLEQQTEVDDMLLTMKGACKKLYSQVKPATNAFYGALELTTMTVGIVDSHKAVPLTALLVSIKAAEHTMAGLGNTYACPEEVARFKSSLLTVKTSVEVALEECS